jgi:hypothetical protein
MDYELFDNFINKIVMFEIYILVCNFPVKRVSLPKELAGPTT